MLQRKTISKSEIRFFDLYCLNTGQTVEGKELWLDIHTLVVNKNKGVNGLVQGKATPLLKIDENTFELLNGGQEVGYVLADDVYFVDNEGSVIPEHDESGKVIYKTITPSEGEPYERPVFKFDKASTAIQEFSPIGQKMLNTFIKYLGYYTKP